MVTPRFYRIIYPILILGSIVGFANEPRVIAMLILFFLISQIAFVGPYAIVGGLLRLPMEDVALGFGSAIFRFKVGPLPLRLNPLPFGAYVKYGREDLQADLFFGTLPLHKKVLLALSGPVVSTLLGILLTGWLPAKENVRQAAMAIAHWRTGESNLEPLWREYFEHLSAHADLSCLGFVFLWMGIWNLIPWPGDSGGLTIGYVARSIAGKKAENLTNLILFFPGFAFIIWLLFVNISAIHSVAYRH